MVFGDGTIGSPPHPPSVNGVFLSEDISFVESPLILFSSPFSSSQQSRLCIQNILDTEGEYITLIKSQVGNILEAKMGNTYSRQQYYETAEWALDEAWNLHQEAGGPPPGGAILDWTEGQISTRRMIHVCTRLEVSRLMHYRRQC